MTSPGPIFAPIMAAVRRLRGQAPPAPNPLGLSDAEVAALRALRSDDGYAVFLKALDGIIRLQSEGLLRPSARSATVHFQRGQIAGLVRAGTLVDEVVKADDDRTAVRAEAERRKRDAAAGRAAALYASPFGDGTR